MKGLNSMNRREFIKTSTAAAAAALAFEGAKPAYSATNRLGIGMIGAGSRAGEHLSCLHWLKTQGGEDIEITAVCDVYRPRIEKVLKGYAPGAKAYADYRKLLEDPGVDAVCISTPDHWHAVQALDALRAGKDVYCEKPITHWRQFELAKQLARAARDSSRVVQVGTQGMYDSAWHQMRKYVRDGMIGPPIHAECGYFRTGDMGERGMTVDDPAAKPGPDLDWEAFLGDSPKRSFDASRFFRWRMYEDYAGGPATDLYPHSLTPVLYVLDLKMPSVVTATGGKFRYTEREVPDTFNVLIDYPEKVTVTVSGTLGNDNQGTGLRGTGMKIPILRGWDGSLTIEGNEIVFVPAPPGLDWDEKPAGPPRRFAIEHGEDLVEYWRHFLNCCRSRERNTLCPMDLAYHAQTPLLMAIAGWREGKVARFDAASEKIVLS
jgi:predicted dehydrogenase